MRRLACLVTASLLGMQLLMPPAGAAAIVTFTGGGWGHGIGMSQYGAYGRALAGSSATEILEHYYSGTKVETKTMPSVRVGLLQYRKDVAVRSVAAAPDGGKIVFKVKGGDAIASGGPAADWKVVASKTGGMRLYKNGKQVKKDGRSVFGDPRHPLLAVYEPHGSLVHVVEKATRYAYGRLSFGTFKTSSCGSDYCLRLVLVLPMQKYLYGLGEVPASWPRAVLVAQAIAGRTYAYEKSTQSGGGHRYPCDCLVYDSVIDQAYIGDAKRTGSGRYWDDWKSAVDGSDGKVVLYGGAPIQALYSSSSGGHTEHNENVWGGTPVPYLRGVADAPDDVPANPNHTWKHSLEWSSLSGKLSRYYETGALRKIELVEPFGVSGRVTVVRPNGTGGVRIVGAGKTVRVSGWSLRSALGLKDTLFRIRLPYAVGRIFLAKYRGLNEAPGTPLSRVYDVPKRSSKVLGRAQEFAKGRITYDEATGRRLWQYGRLLARYDALGRERSALGMPRSDVRKRDGYLVAGYRRGRIFWSRSTGARAVVGAFDTVYRSVNGARGPLGLPRSGRERGASLPDGGVRQRFVRGALYRTPHGGKVFALWGAIAGRYASIGEGASRCGYPTASQKVSESVHKATFQHGEITYTPAVGTIVDCN